MDPLYLQAISELESEHNVVFPPDLVKILADKTFHRRVCVMGYETYHCAHPLDQGFLFHYVYPRKKYSIPKVSSKVELYKTCINLPVKLNASTWIWEFGCGGVYCKYDNDGYDIFKLEETHICYKKDIVDEDPEDDWVDYDIHVNPECR